MKPVFADAVTGQFVNEDISNAPKFGRIHVNFTAYQDTTLVDQCSIKISGWPGEGKAWKLTFPDFTKPITSLHYTVQLDDGNRLSALGGIVAKISWADSLLSDFTLILKQAADTSFSINFKRGLPVWKAEDTQEKSIEKGSSIDSIYYVNFDLPPED